MRARSCLLALLLAVGSARAATHDVGPGQPLAAIGDVPWATLAPGDIVRIHWRAAPYREKWVIARSGTPASPIIVEGVRGPGGERPIIDGVGATTAPGLNYWSETRGIVKIGGANTPPAGLVSDIVLEGLEIRGARQGNTFTDDGGAVVGYDRNASSIYLELGQRIVVRDCELRDCGNGFFVASGAAEPSRDILVEGCYLHGNGNVGSAFEHGNYSAAIGLTFQYNHFGLMLPGADGNNLKDRSAGLVVRYNWIEGGNRQLDLVDAEDSTLILADPAYRDTWVYGNVLIERDADGNRQILHYGGDSGTLADYRKGTLHFYDNTVISYRADRTTLMRLSTNEEHCDARNNIVWCASAAGDTLALVDADGVLDWSRNATKPGWIDTFGALTGVINDDGTGIPLASPGFVDEAGQDFHLAAGSACIDAGRDLEAVALPDHLPVLQYIKHQAVEPRPSDATIDIGAYEAGCVAPPPGLVTNLRVTSAGLAWDATPLASAHDVARGALAQLHAAGLPASVECVENGDVDLVAIDAGVAFPGGTWYLVRALGCGSGTWDSGGPMQLRSRDAPLAGACP